MEVQQLSPPETGWQVRIGRGAAALRSGAFPDRAAAEAWGQAASAAVRASTIRIGSKRFLGTAAEALQRWAIAQGTLPRQEGGTQVAPVRRLAALMADPACALPLAALRAPTLQQLRARRAAALRDSGALLAEQAALAAALEEFRGFHLPALPNPLHDPADDGLYLLEEADCARFIAWAGRHCGDFGRLLGLVLSTGADPAALIAASEADPDLNRAARRLRLPGGAILTADPAWMPPQARAGGPLFPALAGPGALAARMAALSHWTGSHWAGVAPRLETLRLTGLVQALKDGRHPDELLPLLAAPG